MEFKDWIDNRITNLVNSGISNCTGTALYIVGELDEDRYIHKNEHTNILSKLLRKEYPDIGFLIGWWDGDSIYHLGVITNENPLLITNRRGHIGSIKRNESFEETNKIYGRSLVMFRGLKYFVPKKLENLLQE